MASKLPPSCAQTPVTHTCTLCDSEGACWRCDDCQETLCERCKEIHQRGKKTRNDNVLPIKEAKSFSDHILPDVCRHHPNKVCDLYCSDCEEAMCPVCKELHHKQHNWKSFEDEYIHKKEKVQGHLIELRVKLTHLQESIGKNYEINSDFINSIKESRKEVQAHKSELLDKVDGVVGKVLESLSSIEEKQAVSYKKNCQHSEKMLQEMKDLIKTAEQRLKKKTGQSLFDLEKMLETKVPFYDVNTGSMCDKPKFVTGVIDQQGLEKMIGSLTSLQRYSRKEINSDIGTTHLVTFNVQQKSQIVSICGISDRKSYLSILNFSGLVIADKTGVVKECVKLVFNPRYLELFNTTEVLMTNDSSQIHKMTADCQVTVFANISQHGSKAYDICNKNNKEIFVSLRSAEILVLNSSGDFMRKLTCEPTGHQILCTSSNIVIGIGSTALRAEKLEIKDTFDKRKHTWAGELENGQQVNDMWLIEMACDIYDRVFVPDFRNHQVYVLSSDSIKAKSLLHKKHRVHKPTAVCVDPSGDVWIGCFDGTVHVMRL